MCSCQLIDWRLQSRTGMGNPSHWEEAENPANWNFRPYLAVVGHNYTYPSDFLSNSLVTVSPQRCCGPPGFVFAYPRPVASGFPPSVMATVSVRMWSATTLYAISTPSTSSLPTIPKYGRTPVAYEREREGGKKGEREKGRKGEREEGGKKGWREREREGGTTG